MENGELIPELRFPEFEDDWSKSLISSLLKIGSGKDYKHLNTGDIPVYGTGGYMTSVDDYLHDGESVCIGRKGTIDKPMFLKGKFWTVDTLFFTHSYQQNIPKFLYLIFQRINWKKYNEASGVPSLSKKTIEKIKIVVPKPKEQQKIANFLTAIDQRIIKLKEKKAALEQYKKGLMQKIFSQEVRFKDDEGNDFPDWEEKRFSDIGKFYYGKSAPKWSITDMAKIPCVRYGELYTKFNGVVDQIYSYTEIPSTKLKFSKGNELLIPRVGEDPLDFCKVSYIPLKKIAIGEMISVFNTSENTLFLAFFIRSVLKHEFARVVEGGNVSNLYFRYLEPIKFKLPCKEEQQKIADCLSAIDQSINQLTKQIDQTTQFKKGLLQRMFV